MAAKPECSRLLSLGVNIGGNRPKLGGNSCGGDFAATATGTDTDEEEEEEAGDDDLPWRKAMRGFRPAKVAKSSPALANGLKLDKCPTRGLSNCWGGWAASGEVRRAKGSPNETESPTFFSNLDPPNDGGSFTAMDSINSMWRKKNCWQ